ncbi:AMP-binding protein [Leifsonia aquatica]|uniref:AMP-binding protein n=1 Tax=Leifsonia aquatica TaxID=144185 RepID=UPI00384D9982
MHRQMISLMGLSDIGDRIVGAYGEESSGMAVTDGSLVARAAKNPSLLMAVRESLNDGGVAALLPELSGTEYVENVRSRIADFCRGRPDGAGGLLVFPTSGSTGEPKLVALATAGIESFMGWGREYFSFGEDTVSLSVSPWSFDVSLLDTWAVLAAGGRVIAAEPRRLTDASYVARLLDGDQVTFVQAVPSTLGHLVAAAAPGASFHAVEDVVVTGGVAHPALRQAAAALFPRARFHNVYGSTEVNDCLIYTCSADEFGVATALPLGDAIDGCQVLLDAEIPLSTQRPYPIGAEGELWARTPWMAAGYLRDGQLVPLVKNYGAPYPMRDRARVDGDGTLRYLGRTDRTVKIRGQRVDLDQIEDAARSTGLVGDVCAWADTEGHVQELNLACVAHADVAAAPGLRFRLQLSQRLPPYAMPNRIHHFDESLPLNSNGKPHLARIRAQLESE